MSGIAWEGSEVRKASSVHGVVEMKKDYAGWEIAFTPAGEDEPRFIHVPSMVQAFSFGERLLSEGLPR